MHLPLTVEELDHQLAVINDAVLASSAVARRVATADEQPVQQLGRRLFDALITDDVRALYVTSVQRAREDGAMLRLVLRIRPPELARLPWEFLFDTGQQDYLGLSLPLVRYPRVLSPRQPLQVAATLRILGMVARPGDRDALDVDDEQRRLRAALAELESEGLVELVWVRGQTYGDLEDALDHGPWHVFHFVGHGGYDAGSDEGTIALASEAGRTDSIGTDEPEPAGRGPTHAPFGRAQRLRHRARRRPRCVLQHRRGVGAPRRPGGGGHAVHSQRQGRD